MSLLLIIIIILGLIIYLKFGLKIRIKWKTFFKKGFIPQRGKWGIYCYEGKQGKGKTFSVVEYMLDNKNKSVYFSNIRDVKGVEFTYFQGFNGLIQIKHDLDSGKLVIPKNKQLVIVFDELFTELQRGSKLTPEIMDFCCQLRKRKIIMLTTCQQWRQVPKDFRDFCRYEISCDMINLLFFGILIKTFKDAENDKWSDEEQDFVAPIISKTITKCRVSVANNYDTYLRISSVPIARPERSEDFLL